MLRLDARYPVLLQTRHPPPGLDWERFIRRLLDSEKVELFLTGLSSALLSREIATALRGRAWKVVMVNPRKAYPVDPGLIPVFDRTGRSNIGHALETAVLVELERRHAEVAYMKTSQEFDPVDSKQIFLRARNDPVSKRTVIDLLDLC